MTLDVLEGNGAWLHLVPDLKNQILVLDWGAIAVDPSMVLPVLNPLVEDVDTVFGVGANLDARVASVAVLESFVDGLCW